MERSVTLDGWTLPRILSLVFGLGMVVASALTVDHYFAANFPESIFEGSFCDINAFFNCDSSAYSPIAAVAGVPLGWGGVFVGGLVVMGALFPSPAFERSNGFLQLLNALGIVALFAYTVFGLGTLCLLCAGYYVSGLAAFALFWRRGAGRDGEGPLRRLLRPSPKHLAVWGVLFLAGARGFSAYHEAKVEARGGGVAGRIVEQFHALPLVPNPGYLSPRWTARATEEFEDAPIRVVEFADPLCPDCRYLDEQLRTLEEEFGERMNVVYQFFPLEAVCNDVVEKDLHPGACEVSWMLAGAPDHETFMAMHDEIVADVYAPREAEWRADFARRWGVEGAAGDGEARGIVARTIATGREYERTSEEHAHGIRSTPTMIVNNRMVIGTLPPEQLRAIFRSLVDAAEEGRQRRFIESWVDEGQ